MKMSRPGSGQHTTLLSDPAFTGEVYEVRGYRAYALSRRRGTQGEAGAGLMAGDYKASGPMLDSRRDCRYRRGAHRSIREGLRKVTFHDMSGPQEEIPGFPSGPFMGLRARPSEEKAGGVMPRPIRARTIESARLFLVADFDDDVHAGGCVVGGGPEGVDQDGELLVRRGVARHLEVVDVAPIDRAHCLTS